MAITDQNQQQAPEGGPREPEVNKLFRYVLRLSGSDLRLAAGQPPTTQVKGVVQQVDMAALGQDQMEQLLYPMLNKSQRENLNLTGGSDFTYVIGQDECQFRVNLFKRANRLGLVARRVV